MSLKREYGQEQPYIPLGIFKVRIPLIHYRLEWVEIVLGFIMVCTCLSYVPVGMDNLGLSYELGVTLVIINGFLYTFHTLLGDPVIPGWITPCLPLTVAWLSAYPMGPERIKAAIAVQLLVAAIFFIMGSTGMAAKFMSKIPNSLKAGILMGSAVAAVMGEFKAGGRWGTAPITISIAVLASYYFLFSDRFANLREKYSFAKRIGMLGFLPALVIGFILGPLLNEIKAPIMQWGLFMPRIGEAFRTLSPFSIGFPGLDMFISAIPLAITAYVIAFGDFVTAQELMSDADRVRPDEKIDYNPNRSNLVCAIRNAIEGFFSPFIGFAGPIWVATSATVSERYKQAGRTGMDSIFSGFGTFRLTTFIAPLFLFVSTFLKPYLPLALSISMFVQGFVCIGIAVDLMDNKQDKGIAGVMAVILAMKGALWGLAAGVIMYLLIGSPKSQAVEVKNEDNLSA